MPPPEPRAITAILVGATGLVGSAILRLALAEPRIGAVVVLARRSTGAASPKLREHLVDFEAPATFTGLLRGDVLFSALGTTVRAAGSREAQYRVDHDAQLRIAAAARRNGVPALVLVSAAGASSASPFFYARMKGLLERDVVKLGFERTRLLRPGLLEGERAEVRRGEKLALRLLRPIARFIPYVLRPMPAEVVARAAVQSAFGRAAGVIRYEAAELFRNGA
ncbi:MAG TPA: NAD(P)H-binding protein [Anaeromyxobacter sp.]